MSNKEEIKNLNDKELFNIYIKDLLFKNDNHPDGITYEMIETKNKIIIERFTMFLNYIKNLNKDDLIEALVKNSTFVINVKYPYEKNMIYVCNRYLNDILDRKLTISFISWKKTYNINWKN